MVGPVSRGARGRLAGDLPCPTSSRTRTASANAGLHLVETKLGLPTALTADGLINRRRTGPWPTFRPGVDPGRELTFRDRGCHGRSQPNTGRLSFGLPALRGHRPHTTPGDLTASRSWTSSRPRGHLHPRDPLLIEHEVPVQPKVATALLYGIETEVSGYPGSHATWTTGPSLSVPAGRQGPWPGSARPGSRTPLRGAAPGPPKLVHLRPADRELGDDLPQPSRRRVVDFMVRFEKVDWALWRRGLRGQADPVAPDVSAGVQAGTWRRQVVGPRQGRRATTGGPAGA